ncbi:MAG: hypothetical protein Q8K72_06905, partial [Acidimicrobiales bacterium]|nr:hypothetical protein [Acidimicrobiales bacterium]
MFARRIAVVGTGYVGLTTGACLASLGHRVVCADIDTAKIERLRRGEVDILEPGLVELVVEGMAAGRLEFVVGAREAISRPDELPVEVPFIVSNHPDLQPVAAFFGVPFHHLPVTAATKAE